MRLYCWPPLPLRGECYREKTRTENDVVVSKMATLTWVISSFRKTIDLSNALAYTYELWLPRTVNRVSRVNHRPTLPHLCRSEKTLRFMNQPNILLFYIIIYKTIFCCCYLFEGHALFVVSEINIMLLAIVNW